MQIPESELNDKRFEGGMSHIRLHSRGDGYCKMANKPSGPRAFYLRKCNDLGAMKV